MAALMDEDGQDSSVGKQRLGDRAPQASEKNNPNHIRGHDLDGDQRMIKPSRDYFDHIMGCNQYITSQDTEDMPRMQGRYKQNWESGRTIDRDDPERIAGDFSFTAWPWKALKYSMIWPIPKYRPDNERRF
jgi:hypothetical protein